MEPRIKLIKKIKIQKLSLMLAAAAAFVLNTNSIYAIDQKDQPVNQKKIIKVDPDKLKAFTPKSVDPQNPIIQKKIIQNRSTQSINSQPNQTGGGTGVYVLDNVDFNPIGGGKITGLGWNNKIPFGQYYQFDQHSYLIITGTVHGKGLTTGTGQDDWTFSVRLDDSDILSDRPTHCRFSRSVKPQTWEESTAWKYQYLLVINDTATQPECFEYFKGLASKAIKVRWAKIVGPGWTGNGGFKEPRERLYKSGPMLPLNTNVTSGHVARSWIN